MNKLYFNDHNGRNYSILKKRLNNKKYIVIILVL